MGPADLLTSPVPPPGSQVFLQPLSSTTVEPRNPVPAPSPDTFPPALEDASAVETQSVCSSEQGPGCEQDPESTDTPEGSSSTCLWGPNSLFEGMELVACPRLPCPDSQDLQPGPQKATMEPSAFSFLNM